MPRIRQGGKDRRNQSGRKIRTASMPKKMPDSKRLSKASEKNTKTAKRIENRASDLARLIAGNKKPR
jgi:hypothetical protein